MINIIKLLVRNQIYYFFIKSIILLLFNPIKIYRVLMYIRKLLIVTTTYYL